MCKLSRCKFCKKSTWSGCGEHIDSTLENIPVFDRCLGWQAGKCPEEGINETEQRKRSFEDEDHDYDDIFSCTNENEAEFTTNEMSYDFDDLEWEDIIVKDTQEQEEEWTGVAVDIVKASPFVDEVICKPKRKRQCTEGEPCRLEVCQFPVLMSNAINQGNYIDLDNVIQRFMTDTVQLSVDMDDNIKYGCQIINEFFTSILEVIPDVISEIKSIKLKQPSLNASNGVGNIIFLQMINGTIVFPTTMPTDKTHFVNKIGQAVRNRVDRHIEFVKTHISQDTESASMKLKELEDLQTLCNNMLEKGEPANIRIELNGNLHFRQRDVTDGTNKHVHKLDMVMRIKFTKPSSMSV
jgi:hypothetical protein